MGCSRRIGRIALLCLGACGGDDPAPLPGCTDPPRGPSLDLFTDVTADSGIDFRYASSDFRGGALAVADLDGDGLPDLVLGSRLGGLAEYRNRGSLQFEPVAESGLDPTLAVTALAAVDLDGDGDLDLIIAGPGVAYVMANQGDGTFVQAAQLDDSGATEHILPVDLDGDGLLDLYFSNRDLASSEDSVERRMRAYNRLYMNLGGLHFSTPQLVGDGLSWAATAYDVDGDGDQDIYVANDTLLADFGGTEPPSTLPPDMLLRNDGPGPDGMPHFTDVAPAMGLTEPRSSMGGTLGDFDGDGTLDLYVPNLGAKKLFLREGDAYVDGAASFGVQAINRVNATCGPGTIHSDCLFFSWSAVLTDFDLDGYDELLVTNGMNVPGVLPPVLMFKRGSQLAYDEVSPDFACMDAHAAVAADFDGDGDQDLVIAQRVGPLKIYENRGAPATSSWLRVRLHGHASNRGGVGAVVTAHMVSGRSQVRVVGAGGIIHSSSPLEAFFGLGSDQVATLSVQWPSGQHSDVSRPSTGVLLIEEPD